MIFKSIGAFAHYFTCARYYFFAKFCTFLSFFASFFSFHIVATEHYRAFFGNSQRKCYLCGHKSSKRGLSPVGPADRRKVRAPQSIVLSNGKMFARAWQSVTENNRLPPTGTVRVKRWGKSPPRRWRHSLAVHPTRCKTKYIDVCRAARPMSRGRLLEVAGNCNRR